MVEILTEIDQACQRGERFALTSLVWSSGSVPMSERAKMMVFADGRAVGTIGGGCLEAEVVAMGLEVLEQDRPALLAYTMTEAQAGEGGLNCGGTVRLFTEPIDPVTDGPAFAALVAARRVRRGCTLAVLLDHELDRGSRAAPRRRGRLVLAEDGERFGTLGIPEADAAVAARLEATLSRGRGSVVDLGLDGARLAALGWPAGRPVEVFLEPFLPPPVLYVFGGGHVGGQLARLAHHVGFRVVVCDDRPQFANPKRHPEADDWIVGDPEELFARLPVDGQTYIVAVTRGHQQDERVVEQAIRTPARYVGMIGSERKKVMLWERLTQRGADPERLAAVSAPVGLNIGADTPEEIAVSIVAELIQVRRGPRRPWRTKAGGGAP
ncbi:MAG: XdhC family protein [Candidatus Latescibacterota bacterium]|jgi:xanthine dehydrogenase accessory factor